MREGYLERDGVRLHWVEWGPPEGDQPPLFCLHGLSSNALYWGRLAARLPHRRLLALDQRAHGLSDAPASGYDSETLVADAAFAINSLGLVKPLLAGHSWGALIALDLAATHPGLGSGLAHIDGPGLAMSARLSWEQAAAIMQPPLPVFRSPEEAWADQAQYLADAWADDLRDFAEGRTVKEDGVYRLTLTAPIRLEILRAMYAAHPELMWARVEGPVLLALAEAGPPMREWKQQLAARVQEVRPDAAVRWYPSAHDIPLILPDRLAADVEAVCREASAVSRGGA